MKLPMPPGPKGEFIFGCLRQNRKPLELYTNAFQAHGDMVKLPSMFGFHWYMFANPAAIEHVLQKNQLNYRKPDSVVNNFSLLSGQGLFVSDGQSWLNHRRLMQPAFHRQELSHLSSLIANCAGEMLSQWHEIGDNVIDISAEMMRLAVKIVGLSLFSQDISDQASTIGGALRVGAAYVSDKLNSPFSYWLPNAGTKQFEQARDELDRVVFAIINSRRGKANEAGQDLLSMLLNAQDADTGEFMSDKQLRDEVMTLLLAGHDTVGAALTWTFYLLSQNPDKRAILEDELRSVLGGRLPEVSDLSCLPYTRMVFEEAMRLYPPAWGQARQAKDDDEVYGYLIPKNEIIVTCQYVAHRHPEFWTSPETFEPERFTADACAQRPKFAYFPFGGGSRMCIGNNFSMMEGQLVVAALAQHFRVDVLPGQQIELDTAVTLRPKQAIKARLRALCRV